MSVPPVAHHFNLAVIFLDVGIVDINFVDRPVRVLLFGLPSPSVAADAGNRCPNHHQHTQKRGPCHHVRAPPNAYRGARGDGTDVLLGNGGGECGELGGGPGGGCWFGHGDPSNVRHSARVVSCVYSPQGEVPVEEWYCHVLPTIE